MKLITLNVWGGKVFEPLMEFLRREAPTTDIFCFQEMLNTPHTIERQDGKNVTDLFLRCVQTLSEFEGFFDSVEENWYEDMGAPWGLATFVRRTIPVSERGEFFVFRERNTMIRQDPSTIPRSIQYLKFVHDQKQFTLCNFHGLYKEGSHKLDTPERLAQSQKIQQFLNGEQNVKILCGDFNLAPDTESMRILEGGMRNLVKEYGVTSTRSRLYRHYDRGMLYGDYVLVDPEVDVHNFKVFQDEVSDHLPLMVELR